ncbi:MAG: hypothetical protein WDO68_30145 [Gammaproteobacteria bacterium]
MSTIADAELMALFGRWRVRAETYRAEAERALVCRDAVRLAAMASTLAWCARDLASLLDNRTPIATGEDG